MEISPGDLPAPLASNNKERLYICTKISTTDGNRRRGGGESPEFFTLFTHFSLVWDVDSIGYSGLILLRTIREEGGFVRHLAYRVA